ncbi:hypothetical protein [Geothrix sp. SG200]|uniref:hypothetical protein n=1 Tax=Geothrix sp. SG200 TaxID=2922865 RepID=UPI001FAE0A8B|nr:hypothetical protein [Geothrix sp. SG200]
MLIMHPFYVFLAILPFLSLAAKGISDNTKPAMPRVFIHSRGDVAAQPFMETWREGNSIHFRDGASNKSFTLQSEVLTESTFHPPALLDGWAGFIKYRRGAWWFLRPERGHLPEQRLSELYRFDPESRSWKLLHRLEVRAAHFEVMDEDSFLLFGVFDPVKGRYHLAGTLTGGTLDLLDACPIQKRFPELFWKACVTGLDDRMAYAYFPMSGDLCGYDLDSHTLRRFRVPWPLLTDESLDQDIERAKPSGKDIFISTVEHPSTSAQCYFLPIQGGSQMAFIYKSLDVEEEKQFAFSDGSRPVIEKVGAIMLVPDDPNLTINLTPPSQKSLERWCWSSVANRLVPMESLKKALAKAPSTTAKPAKPQPPSPKTKIH